MVTTTSLKVGESLSIGLYFNDNYQLPSTCNLIVFIGGVCVGNLFTQQPEIDRIGVYYTIRLSSQDTSKMRGYRDLIVILDDPEGFGNKKTIVGGILFDRMADEFITTSENQGYNMLIEMTVDQSIVSGNAELIEAMKGDKGEDAVLPDGIVIDEDYVHTDNNYTDADKSLLSTALQSEVDPVYSLDKDRLLNTSGTNTGDQDLTGLVEKVPLHSLVPDTEIDKLSEYPELLEETTNKVISDTGELVSIPTPSGGYANNLYFGETDSDVAGYKILTYIADTAETIKTVTANSSAGVVTAQTFLYPTGVSVSNFPSGLWSLKLWGNISASAGVSQVGFTYFKRSVAGVETDLFTLWSEEVNNTSDTWIDVIGTQPSYSVDPTDRMGLRLLFKTTSGANKTLTYSIGDGYAAFVNNPNQIRHSQARDKNGEAAFQHVDTTTTKPALVAADMVAIKDSVTGKMVLAPKSNFVEAKPDVWYPLTLANGWVNTSETDKASFLKDSIGVIHLRGRIKDGTVGTAGFALPLGFYREGITMELPLVSGYGSYGRLLIVSNGACYINVDYNQKVELSSISFKL